MGRVKDIYIKYEAAGDQYVGCILCGLNLLNPTFAQTAPPFFRIDGDLGTCWSNEHASREIENAALMNNEDVGALKTCSLTEIASPFFQRVGLVKTIQLKLVATMCFASLLLLSMDFLQKCSPFQGSALFAVSINEKLKEAVIVTYPWKKEFGDFGRTIP